MKLIIDYDSDAGYVFPDGKAEHWVDEIIKVCLKQKEDQKISVASGLLVDFFRLRLVEGVLKADQIEFTFKGETLRCNSYGTMEHWPKGYCDIPIEPVEKLLTLQAEKGKKAKIEREKRRKNGNKHVPR